VNSTLKTSFSGELYRQFAWFDKTFTPLLNELSVGFFFEGLEYKLIGLSVNMNVLTQSESFFVTKVQLNEKNEFYARLAQNTICIMLDKLLGKMSKRKFDLSKLTDLEAKIITAFNNSIHEAFVPYINTSDIGKNTDVVNLSYNVRNIATNESGRLVLSLPLASLKPETINSAQPSFYDRYFSNSLVDVSIRLGVTNFPVIDVKKLDIGDLVIFENSDINTMTLFCEEIVQDFQVNPNYSIKVDYEELNGDDNMEQNVNLWDSIQVEMYAEFDKVKISLGELKDIEEDQVVDVSSVYNNKVSLKVGDKTVAKGELVIVNDRYGVKIQSINSSQNEPVDSYQPSELPVDNDSPAGGSAPETESQNEEDFDYSDFDLDDQDI